MKRRYRKNISMILLSVVMCISLSACATIGGNGQNYNSNVEYVTNVYKLTKEDQRTEFNSVDVQKHIDLNQVNESILLISEAGDYKLSGTYYGQIHIATDNDEVVHLFMDSANLYSKCGPAIYIEEADKVVITLLDGTQNTVTDTVDYDGYEEQASCIYSNADITFNGNGSISVYGYNNDAVKSKGYIKLADVHIEVRSKDIGIRANDGIFISNSTLDIQSEGSGLYTKNADKEGKGHIEILSGNISIISGKNAIYSAANVHIFGGTVAVNSVDEKIKSGGIQYIKEGCLQ